MMQSMGLQRIGEDLATEEEQQQLQNYYCQVAKKKKTKPLDSSEPRKTVLEKEIMCFTQSEQKVIILIPSICII